MHQVGELLDQITIDADPVQIGRPIARQREVEVTAIHAPQKLINAAIQRERQVNRIATANRRDRKDVIVELGLVGIQSHERHPLPIR